MTSDPTPGKGWPADPAGGWLWRVSCATVRGRAFSRIARQEKAARSFAVLIVTAGGNPRLHRTRVTSWQETQP